MENNRDPKRWVKELRGRRSAARPVPSQATERDPGHCSIRITHSDGKNIEVEYVTLLANRPRSYENFFAIWESFVVPWGVKPEYRKPVESDVSAGTQNLKINVTLEPYTIAYCTGPEVTDACTYVTLPPARAVTAPSSVTIAADEISLQKLVIGYRTLYGYLPRRYGNWVGLWRGLASPYNAPKPLARAKPGNASEGNLVMDGLSLDPDSVHTLIYFMEKSRTSAAAMCTFRTPG
ncbi:hypothetical protein [Actinomadura sp.]|uniref:hypothetical protein n=1 Tax=Actinomadura sp. TaxID=1989 RepID=UPI0033457CC5